MKQQMKTSGVHVVLAVNEDVLDEFQRQAIIYGFCRMDPEKPWTSDEKRECVRFVVKTWFCNFCDERGISFEVPED